MSKLSRFLGLDIAPNHTLRLHIDSAVGQQVVSALVTFGIPPVTAWRIWRDMLKRVSR